VLSTPGHCVYSFYIYPTSELEAEYRSDLPSAMTVFVACAFAFLIGVFFMYDFYVHRRNTIIQKAAVKSNAIVSSLFPSNVRERLFNDAQDQAKESKVHEVSGKKGLISFLTSAEGDVKNEAAEEEDNAFYKTKPIADLFTDTTVLFADIAGFTAWSSTREPTQVFILLETIYKAFDDIAKTRRVFKVETVGDCYVAVTGLPDPRKDHAVAMARFAVECMHRMHSLTAKLEVILGPDTTDLDMRIGLHSGPVTAGVLRGERSRFQLFGDTMNTASRMESNGQAGKIQLSQETTDLLIAFGKQHWLIPRKDKIFAKGKGEMQTYWLSTSKITASKGSDVASISSDINQVKGISDVEDADQKVAELLQQRDLKTDRLVQWNVDVLLTLLKKVVLRRGPGQNLESAPKWESSISSTVLDEVREIVSLPTFDAENQTALANVDNVDVGEAVEKQLKEYVTAVASMYCGNPFHNFEHASHVTMSVVKLMSRVVAPDVEAVNSDMEKSLHDYTFGITSDPLTQFACVFSALIHDVDHSGVPNTQLEVENPALAAVYKNKSVAEQNSVDLSWDLLQDESFSDLRAAIYITEDEMQRFRQLVVNSVMATDIMDKDLKTLRNARWDRAFAKERTEESKKDAIDRKATIVIEHLIQASDVSHTMQHWHIYRKWNQRLFEELYSAYVEGRSANDPSDSWYKGEIGFFDFYIIPLAKKLKECGVFGVSSDEYLNYAEKNRNEWDQRGQELVASMVEDVRLKYGCKNGGNETAS
jgi:class 3 adenylate cyclase